MSALEVRGLTVRLGRRTLVEGVDLDLEPGRILALVGESGSGKTVTARSLLGLQPEGAEVSVERLRLHGRDASRLTEHAWRSIRGRTAALVSQDALAALDPLRRVGAEVAEPRIVHALPGDTAAAVRSLLERVAVPEPDRRARQYPHELSGGQRQRALIASALAAEPTLLIADEPTTALDATVQARVLDLLRRLAADGLAVLLISHDLGLVARIADEVAVMAEGRIVERGPADRVLRSPEHPVTRALVAAAPTPRTPWAAGGEVVLQASGLVRAYDGVRAVDDVSLELHAGRTLGVVGESGSGKSTLARLLLGLEEPDAGTVTLEGRPWSQLPERQRRSRRDILQPVDQDTVGTFDPRMTVARVLDQALAFTVAGRTERRRRSRELLDSVRLDGGVLRRRPRELSGGQRQRLALARALAREPRILICDEPVSALDVSVQATVLDLIAELQRERDLAVLFVSHDLDVVAAVSDDVLVMQSGRVVERGSATQVLQSPGHPFTQELVAASRGG